MKKIILVPDSFKGTLSSMQVCDIMKSKIVEFFPNCEVVSVPVADGGEGSVDCFLRALGGERIFLNVNNPYFNEMEAFYGVIDNGNTAIIEMASCAGLPLVENCKNPLKTTTFGVGQLILDAAKRGCKKIIVGLGGSCTNDGGAGAAAAVGIKFFDYSGNEFIPTGGTLIDIARIDIEGKSPLLNNVEIVTMCDIDNTLYGENGAAHVFAPQKGATTDDVLKLDEGLINFCNVLNNSINVNVKDLAGGGAAGGMGAGMVAFFNSKLNMGIETVLDTVRFDALISDANIIFTGEGKIDYQSLRGKVVVGVAKRAKLQNKPVIVIAGGAESDINAAYENGVTAVFTINRLPEDFEVSRHKSEENMALTMDNILRLMKECSVF